MKTFLRVCIEDYRSVLRIAGSLVLASVSVVELLTPGATFGSKWATFLATYVGLMWLTAHEK